MPFPFLLVCPFFFISSAFASDVYEVTALPILTPSEPIGGRETIITTEEIETYQETFLKDALPYSPSVNVNSIGTVGRQVDFSIRGARSSQNLVLFNGIYVNDPASGGGVDLAHFLNTDLETIKVLPGAQSLAYGPGALGGVIQLVSKHGHGKPSLKVHGEGGSFKTKYGTLTAQGEEGPLQFSMTAAGFGRGSSPFTNPLHGNRQGDFDQNGTLSSRIGYALTNNWEVEGLVRYAEGKVQFDNPQFVEGVFLPFEAQNFSNTKTLLASLENKWGEETWNHSLKGSTSRIQQKTDTPFFTNNTIGEHPLLSYRTEFKASDCHILSGGLEGGQERAKDTQQHKRSHGGIFLIHIFKPYETTTVKAGIRGDHYESVGNYLTYSIGADHNITPSTTVRASYGTNFKPPILSDLFQTPWQIANPFLKPEKSQSFEAGFDQTFCEKKINASLTGFFTRIDQVTLSRQLPGGQWQRFNGGRRMAKGLEMTLALKPLATLEIKGALTFTHSIDFPQTITSPLIPTVKGAGGIHWQSLPNLSFFVQGYSVTTRKDSVTRRTLAPYGIINIGANYDVHSHARLFWRVENLTDKRYEEVFGYGVRGQAFFFGIEAKT